MKLDSAAAWDHLDRLAEKHQIIVRLVRRRSDAEAHTQTRQVWVPPQRKPLDYLVGLHELGHIVSPSSRAAGRRQMKAKNANGVEAEAMACEAAAWAWAVRHADPKIVTLTETLRAEVGRLWASHLLR